MSGPDLEAGRAWLATHGAGARLLPHGDPDGLAAGALLARRVGGAVSFADPFVTPPSGTDPLVVADQGVRPLGTTAPVLYVDHHAAPEPVPGGVVVWDGAAGATAHLAWRLLGEPADGTWLAALGLLGDLGERGVRDAGLQPGPLAPLRRVATLCSAAGRLRDGPLPDAYTMLTTAADAASALQTPQAATLDATRREVEAIRRAAGKVAPRVGPGAALIELDVPARVHSQVASAWARRLAPRPVVVANRGWRAPDRVSFAVRSADGRDLRAWLRGLFTPPPGAGDYARGHARATGGSLVPAAYEQFAAAVLAAP